MYIKGKIRKQFKNKFGYLKISLYNNNIELNYSVHRLVAMSFKQNSDFSLEVDHINGVKTDNKLVNLEFVTCSENIRRSYSMGLQNKKGENHTRCKLNKNKVIEIRKRYKSGSKQIDLANEFNIVKSNICNIVHDRSWNYPDCY